MPVTKGIREAKSSVTLISIFTRTIAITRIDTRFGEYLLSLIPLRKRERRGSQMDVEYADKRDERADISPYVYHKEGGRARMNRGEQRIGWQVC